MLNIDKIKKNFPLFDKNSVFYLDNAASSQTPRVVLDALEKYYTDYRANIHRGLYTLSTEATERYEGARATLADFIGAKSNEIVFTSGSTASMNMLVYGLETTLNLKEGDEIVTTVTEHHSSLIPLQELAKRKKLVLKHIPITEDFELDYDKARELITPKTKIVSITHAANVLGGINDVALISKLAHGAGAVCVIDAAKTAGHIPIDVKELDCDFLFFSGHKMCGPTGIGALYGKKEWLDKLHPSFFGGGTVEDVTALDSEFVDAPHKFEPGTPNIAGAIGFAEAVRYLENIGVDNIENHISDVLEYAIEKLSEIDGIVLHCQKDPQKNVGVISFDIEGVHSHDMADILSKRNVAVRSGHHCAQPLMNVLGVSGTVRASFYFYNGKEDVDALVEGIHEVKNIFK
ncbi:aminotransferase class V-fold PLP-dependent enzyme [Patescibacteria group bacterium]